MVVREGNSPLSSQERGGMNPLELRRIQYDKDKG
jgi:hypothetical protein